jgi:hypothetical protein
MNNFEKIKQMSFDEILDFLNKITDSTGVCSYCKFYNNFLKGDLSVLRCGHICRDGVEQWLLQEVEE